MGSKLINRCSTLLVTRKIQIKTKYFYTTLQSLQLCPTLCHPMDYSPLDSSVHGILQARILVWVANALLQGIFLTRGLNLHLLCLLQWKPDSLPLSHQGSLYFTRKIVNIDNSQSMRMRVTPLVGVYKLVKPSGKEIWLYLSRLKIPMSLVQQCNFCESVESKIYSSMCIYYARMSIVSIAVLLITLGTENKEKSRSFGQAK